MPPNNVDPRDRFPSADDIARALGEVLDRKLPRTPLSDQFDPPRPAHSDPYAVGGDRDTLQMADTGRLSLDAAKGFGLLSAGFKDDVLPSLQKVTGGFRGLFSGLQSIASLGGSPTTAISAIGGQLGKLASAFGPYGVIAGETISMLSQVPRLMQSFADSLNQYVQLFSPATSQRYARAWSDLSGAIGEQVLPIVESATRVVRWFGDSVAGLTPFIKPLVDQYMSLLGPQWEALGDVFREAATQGVLVLQAFEPFMPLLTEIATGPAKLLTQQLVMMAEAMRTLNEFLADGLGLQLPKFDGSSFGKSAVPSSTTSVSAMISRANEAAFGAGRGADERKRVPNLLDDIKKKFDELPQRIADALWAEIQRIPGVGQAVGAAQAVNDVRNKAGATARDILNRLAAGKGFTTDFWG